MADAGRKHEQSTAEVKAAHESQVRAVQFRASEEVAEAEARAASHRSRQQELEGELGRQRRVADERAAAIERRVHTEESQLEMEVERCTQLEQQLSALQTSSAEGHGKASRLERQLAAEAGRRSEAAERARELEQRVAGMASEAEAASLALQTELDRKAAALARVREVEKRLLSATREAEEVRAALGRECEKSASLESRIVAAQVAAPSAHAAMPPAPRARDARSPCARRSLPVRIAPSIPLTASVPPARGMGRRRRARPSSRCARTTLCSRG